MERTHRRLWTILLMVAVVILFCVQAVALGPQSDVLLVAIDTGSNLDRKSLRKTFWKNKNEKPNNGKDDDRNGYVDDYIGFDAIENKGSGQGSNHGTGVCAVSAGLDDTAEKLPAAVQKLVHIVPIRAFDDSVTGDTYAIVRAVTYALRLQQLTGFKMVINISWVTVNQDRNGQPIDDFDQQIYDVLEVARNRGVLVVAAVGNDKGKMPRYPAAYGLDNIIAVSATEGNTLAYYSNILGDIAADGSIAWSKGKIFADGTSFATPRVSRAAGALLALNPKWGYLEAIAHIFKSADEIPELEAKVKFKRKLNLQRALALK